MTPYQPSVRCSPPIDYTPKNCDQILWSMPTSKSRQIFGPRGDPGVQVGLPYELENGKSTHDPNMLAQRLSTSVARMALILELINLEFRIRS